MPADDALGPDEDQVSAPVTAESADHHPQELVASAQPRSSPSWPRQYGELMAKQDILGDQCLTVTQGRTDEAEEQQEILEHRPKIMPHRAPCHPGRLLRPDSPVQPLQVVVPDELGDY